MSSLFGGSRCPHGLYIAGEGSKMGFDPDRCHRKSLRLKSYDYTREGAYFVTICTQGRAQLFGDIRNGVMFQNDQGKAIINIWNQLPIMFPHVVLDASILMPNHLHGILFLRTVGAPLVGALRLGDVIGAFKSLSTVAYARGVQNSGWPAFAGRLWQRNFHEHIIRNDVELETYRGYILSNPTRWEWDQENDMRGAPTRGAPTFDS